MRDLLLRPSGPVCDISLGRRQFLRTAGAAGAGLVFAPNLAFATEDPCAKAMDVLASARADAENPRPWAQDYGRAAIDGLRREVDAKLKALENAERREGALETALLVDTVSAVGGWTFVALGFTKVATGVGLAGVTAFGFPAIAVAGVIFGGAVYAAQLYTDKKAADVKDGIEALGAPALLIEHGVPKFPTEGVWMVGTGVRTFADVARHSLGFLGAGFATVEAIQ